MLAAFFVAVVAAQTCRDIDATDPVWQAVNEQYGKIAEAQRTKNIDALANIYAPDMKVIGPNGESLNREQSLNYSRAAFRLTKQEIHLANTIIRMQLCGDQATATVLQQWSRIQLAFGKPRRFDTAAVQDETWIHTGDGWKRWRIGNVRPGAWYVDDQRVDTRNPYDPDAPAFDPYDPHPKKSVADALADVLQRGGVEAARREFDSLRDSPDYYLSERAMNALGYRLLETKDFPAAIFVLKTNADLFPKSANVYDSLAEAYMRSGEPRLAIENYRKSLTLDPGNTNAVENLKRLEAH